MGHPCWFGSGSRGTAATPWDLFVPPFPNHPNDEDLSSGTPVSGKDGAPALSWIERKDVMAAVGCGYGV
jgi:hypothetical protein